MNSVTANASSGIQMVDTRQLIDTPRRFALSVVVVLAIILLHPYGFLEAEDGPVYFGFMNNQLHPGIPYYYAGYAALIPDLAAGLAYFLPMHLQPPVYMVAAALVGVYFVYELTIFLEIHLPIRPIAVLIACAMALFVVKTNSSFNFFTNLTYSIWPAWLGIFLRMLNGFHRVRASWLEIGVGVLAAFSHPFCIILLPPLVALSFALPKSRNLPWMIEIAFYVAAIIVYLVAGIDHSVVDTVDLSANARKALELFSDHPSVYALIALVTQIFLIVVGFLALARIGFKRRGEVDQWHAIFDTLILSYAGCVTFVIYISSPRFADYNLVQPRYIIPAIVCSVLTLVVLLTRLPSVASAVARIQAASQTLVPSMRRQPRLFVVTVISLFSLIGMAQIKGRQTPTIGLGAFWQGEQFLSAAEAFRDTCREGAFAPDTRDWTKWSLVILCKRADLPAAKEPVPIESNRVLMYGSNELTTTAGREAGTVPTLYRSAHEHPLFRLP